MYLGPNSTSSHRDRSQWWPCAAFRRLHAHARMIVVVAHKLWTVLLLKLLVAAYKRGLLYLHFVVVFLFICFCVAVRLPIFYVCLFFMPILRGQAQPH